MPWNPEAAVTDIRPLSPNLLKFFRDNQTAVLNWANGGPGLADFAVIYNTGEGLLYQIFPNVQVFRERHRTSYENSGAKVIYEVDLIYEVHGTNPTDLRIEAKKRGYALESMTVNIPSATLMNGVANHTRATLNGVTVEHGPLQGEEGNLVIGSALRAAFSYTQS